MRTRIWHSDWKPRWLIRCVSAALLSFMDKQEPESFTFLGFTHLCGQSRAGKFLLKRKSRRDRQASKLRDIKNGLKRRTHRPIEEQGAWLKSVVRGYFAYHAALTNFRSLTG